MAKIQYIKSLARLNSACDSLVSAYEESDTSYHVKQARAAFCRALSGGVDYEGLLDLVEEAVNETHDIDVTDRDYARAVVNALLDTVAPFLHDKEGKA